MDGLSEQSMAYGKIAYIVYIAGYAVRDNKDLHRAHTHIIFVCYES